MMRLLGAILLLASVLPAAAQDDKPRPEDRAAIDACLNSHHDDDRERCITAVFKPCTEAPQGPNDDVPHNSTAGQVECFIREMAVWDEKMDASLKELLSGALGKIVLDRPDGNARKKVPGADIINDMQKTWEDSLVKICDTESMFYDGGTIVHIIVGHCALRETGRHVIWLLDLINDTDR